jgi:tRNA-specific 2-thiouridylase
MIATGHYARIIHGDRSELRTAANSDKDQTYFLYRVNQDALARSLMPIGEFTTKNEVRELARSSKIATAEKKDSQGICFVGKVGIKEFLKQYVSTDFGPIIDEAGRTIGEHDGAIFYTIGQRHGLNVGGGLPYYVTHKDMDGNAVYVTTNVQDPTLWTNQVVLRSNHWINDRPDEAKKYEVRLRYRGPLIGCKVSFDGETAQLELKDEQRAIAAGQSAVLYDEQRVVGGGIISEVIHSGS